MSPLVCYCHVLSMAQTPCVWSPCLLLSCPVHGPDTLCVVPLSATVMSCPWPRHPVCGPLVCYCHVLSMAQTPCVWVPLSATVMSLYTAQTPCVWSPCLLLSCPCTRPRHPVCGPLVCYCHVLSMAQTPCVWFPCLLLSCPVHGPDTLCVSPLVCYCHVPVHGPDTLCVVPLSATVMSLYTAQTPCVWSPCLLLSCPVHGPDTLCVVPLSATVMSLYTAQTPCVWSPCLLLSCPCTRPRHPVCGPLVCYCHVPVHGPDTLCVVPLSATVMCLYTAQTPCVWSPLLLSCACTRPRHPVCGPLVCYCHVPVHGPDTLCVSPLVCYCHVPVHGPNTLCVVPLSATVMSCPWPRHPVCGPLVCYCHVPVHGPDTLCVVPLSATVMSLYTAQTPCV